jgi:ribonuclease P protein component
MGTPGPQARLGLRFLPQERIRRRVDYQLVYDRGLKIASRFSTVFILPHTTGARPSRLGIAATKKLGGAVVRNRAKRLIREVFRRNKIAPGFDIVIIPKRSLLDATLTVLEAEYRTLVERQLDRARRLGGDPGL